MSDDFKAKGFHSKSEMRRVETMSEPRKWTAREIYAKWARKEHKGMPDKFVEFSAYQKSIDALKRECCCTGETSHIAPHKKILCDACETLGELNE